MYKMNMFSIVLKLIKNYLPQISIIIIVVLCLCVILAFKKRKNKVRDKKVIYWMILLSILFFFNNRSMEFMGNLTDSDTFYRFLWAIPVVYMVGYTLMLLWEKRKFALAKLALSIIGVLFLVIVGSSYSNGRIYHITGTLEKIPEEVRIICEIIKENKLEENPVCAFELSLQYMIRAEDPSIVWAIERKKYLYFEEFGYDEPEGKYPYARNILKVVEQGVPIKMKLFVKSLEKRGVDFIIINKRFQMKQYLQEAGLTMVGETKHYSVYRYDG